MCAAHDVNGKAAEYEAQKVSWGKAKCRPIKNSERTAHRLIL